MDFGLARFDTATQTRRLELPEITAPGAAPLALLLRRIAGTNSQYYSWLLKHAAPAPETLPAEGTPERFDSNRLRTAEMIGAASIASWENVLDGEQSAECTPATATEFMRQLLRHCPATFDRVAAFVMNPANWQDEATPATDPAALGKE